MTKHNKRTERSVLLCFKFLFVVEINQRLLLGEKLPRSG